MHYKSFVRCDDPKGVVECSAFRRSLVVSDKMEIKSKSHKMQKKSDANATSSAEKREILPQEIKNESSSSSSFQLMEISRGAQKMNSWSKGLENKSHSKEVARDLLRGALDLQESLLVLGKLQEASHSMAKLKNKQNERSGVLRIDGINERASSARFGDRKYPIQLQESNFLADSSSKDTIEELKRVIRDSLAKHNLLPNADSEETFSSGTRLDSDIPSTSSSQSSTAYGSYFSSSNSVMPIAPPRIAAKGPSLIAKLMGLEDMPSKPLQNSLKKPFQMEKMPGFDIDMPKLRKPCFIMPTGEQKSRRLEDILESMHFKGLLRSSSMNESKSHTPYSIDSFHNHDPPIVVIKPLSHPWLQTRNPFMLASREEEEEHWSTETIPRKLKARDEPLVKVNDGKEFKQLSHPRLQTRKPSTCVSKEEEALKAYTMPKKLKVKDELLFERSDRKEEVVLSSSRLRRRVETNENPTKRHDHEEGAKDGKERGLKVEVKEPKTEKRILVKMKTSGTTIQKAFKKSGVDKKPDKIPEPAKTTRKSTEKGIRKVRSLSTSQEKAVLPAPESTNHEKGMTKNQSFQQETAKSSSTSTSEMATRVHLHPNGDRVRSSTKKGKMTSKHKEHVAKIESLRSRESDKRTEQPSVDESSPTNDCIVTVDQRLADVERTEPLDTEIEDQCCGSQSSVGNVSELTAEDSAVVTVIKELKDDNIVPPNISEGAKGRAYLRALLLSDQEFLNHVEELFDPDVNVPEVSPTECILGQADDCRRLSLDCAKEFIDRRSCPESEMFHPGPLISVPSMKIKIPLHRLLEEVCNGIETMRSYGDVNTENPCDSLSTMLERDMKNKEVSSSIWDLGWRNTFSTDDAMHVVNGLENLLLFDLINEILV